MKTSSTLKRFSECLKDAELMPSGNILFKAGNVSVGGRDGEDHVYLYFYACEDTNSCVAIQITAGTAQILEVLLRVKGETP